MCGIAGYFGWELSAEAGREALTRMCRAMVHRGPDGQGLAVFAQAGMEPQNASVLLVFHPRMAERCLTGPGTFDPALEGLRAPRCFVEDQELHTLAPYAGWGSVLAWNCRRRPRSPVKARELALTTGKFLLEGIARHCQAGGAFLHLACLGEASPYYRLCKRLKLSWSLLDEAAADRIEALGEVMESVRLRQWREPPLERIAAALAPREQGKPAFIYQHY